MLTWIILGLAAWVWLAVLTRAVLARDVRGDVLSGLAMLAIDGYVRLVHGLRCERRELVDLAAAAVKRGEPVIVVSNHASGVDPILIQACCPFFIRWMMMREMMTPLLQPVWDWLEIIPVERNGRDTLAVRTALRHLESGGVLGIFAEGGIERPYGVLMPFEPGVGLLVHKARARVLLAVVIGAPDASTAYAAVVTPSDSRVRFVELREARESAGAARPTEIARSLEESARRALAEV